MHTGTFDGTFARAQLQQAMQVVQRARRWQQRPRRIEVTQALQWKGRRTYTAHDTGSCWLCSLVPGVVMWTGSAWTDTGAILVRQ